MILRLLRSIDRRVLAFKRARRRARRVPEGEARRWIAVHHRLLGRTGHRFNEGLALTAEATRNGRELVLLIHRDAEPEVCGALPDSAGPARSGVSAGSRFAERVRDFVDMLHLHVDPELSGHDLVLMTVATQCELAAFAVWMRELGDPGPRVVIYFHSDRWNRAGEDERRRQLSEIALAAAAIGALPAAVRDRLRLGASTASLAAHLSSLLDVTVDEAAIPLVLEGVLGRVREPPGPAGRDGVDPRGIRLGFLGGAREEKGFHRLPGIVGALRSRLSFRALVQLVNETLPPAAWAELESLAGEPEIETLRGALSPRQWSDAIASCDVLVFPYERIAYRQRTSGIFAEAVAAGIPSIVPDRIWMAGDDHLGSRGRSDLRRRRSESIAEACAEASARLAEPGCAQALAVAEAWRRDRGLAAFLAWAEG